MNYSKPFHVKLSEARLAAGLKQVDLARAVGTTPALISRYESGKSLPRAETLAKLAQFLNVELSEFLDSKQEVEQKILVPFINSESGQDEDECFEVSPDVIRFTRSHPSDIRAFRNLGNSLSPLINDQDIVLVNKYFRRLLEGKIFLIFYGKFFYMKRLYQLPDGGVRIVSDNKDEYPEVILTPNQIDELGFRIIGKVIWRCGFI